MVVRDGEADFAVTFEASTRCEETEGGRTHGVGWGEGDAAVVDSAGEGGGWGAAEREVPFEEVGVGGGGGVEVWVGGLG
jgi:hypothetical protein